jgi:UDP-N-acetylmuramoylalanine--D-glutamate ligase
MDIQAGQRVLVIGLAKSGEGVARLLLKRGVQVVVNERKERPTDSSEVEELEALGAQFVFGGHPLSLLEPSPTYIVKNPGIPYQLPILQEAMARGIPVYTEIEVASWLSNSPIYAITGSNGKTTTTTLVGEMLKRSELHPTVAGNIGVVLSGVVEQVKDGTPIVLEVSSFQLMGTERFHPRIAALLNIYPAHLDYHGSIEAYSEAKWRIFANMSGDDVAVLNYDQPHLRERAAQLSCNVVWFSRLEPVSFGVYVKDGKVMLAERGHVLPIMSVEDIRLVGEHNLENVLAATAVAYWGGAAVEAIRDTLREFGGVEHRIEFVRSVRGVDFYNDSKATNPQAAIRALRSFPGNIVWVAGGLDRGDDFLNMVPEIKHRVKAAVLLGQSAEALMRACERAEVPVVEHVNTLEDATKRAFEIAKPGDVVLLSPASASWDMFESFEVRGRMFKDIVHTL